MATQLIDGSFSETRPLGEALEVFQNALDSGTAKAFHVGSIEQIEKVKEEKCLSDKIGDVQDRLSSLEAKNDKLIIAPTLDQIEIISGKSKILGD